MTNFNDGDRNDREIRREVYSETASTNHSASRLPETVGTNAYTRDRVVERTRYGEDLTERDSANVNRGVLLGLLLPALVAAIGGLLWYTSRPREVVTPVYIPVPEASPSPVASPSPQQTTIIERTREVPVSPSGSTGSDVNIVVPNTTTSPAPSGSTTSPRSSAPSDSTTARSTTGNTEATRTATPPRTTAGTTGTTGTSGTSVTPSGERGTSIAQPSPSPYPASPYDRTLVPGGGSNNPLEGSGGNTSTGTGSNTR